MVVSEKGKKKEKPGRGEKNCSGALSTGASTSAPMIKNAMCSAPHHA